MSQDLPNELAMQKSEESMVQVAETVGPRLDRNTIIQVSANPMASFVRFTSGAGYTQFSGFTVPIVSTYTISESTYTKRKDAAWPQEVGTVLVPYPATDVSESEPVTAPEPEIDWDKRLRQGLDS